MLRLRQMREERGWSLRQVGGFVRVAPSVLSLVERGQHPCYPAWAERLERLFRVSSQELLARVDRQADVGEDDDDEDEG